MAGGVVTGDFGESYRTNQPVLTNLANRVPVSLELMVLAQAVALLIAMPLGIYTAYRPGRNFDKTTMAIGFGLVSLAPFILAMLLILLFAGQLNLLPATGFTRWSNDPLGNLRSLILPTMTLALSQVAIYHQLLRSDMIATLQSDHVLMAKSKGLPTWHVLIRHALRPSSFSLLTLTGVNVGRLIGGSVIVEVIFGIPGIGQMLVQSIYNRDFIVLQGALLFVAAAYVLVNMIVDIMYTFLDPRVKSA
ncbi:MAG: ABC transporter permease [Acidimicrobiales bacterium]|nr:ABC transporter permease [Acidimicrobiales bacterium]